MSLSDQAAKFCNETPLHGFAWAANARAKVGRVFWAILTTGAAILFVYQSTGAIMTYMSDEAVTTFTIETKPSIVLPGYEVVLPARFSKHKGDTLGVSPEVMSWMHFSFLSTFSKGYNSASYTEMFHPLTWREDLAKLSQQEGNLKALLQEKNMTYGQLVQALSYGCLDFVTECRDQFRTMGTAECCEMAKDQRTNYGFGAAFPAIKQYTAGSGQGHVLRITVPKQDFVPGFSFPYSGVMMRPQVKDEDSPILYLPFYGRSKVEVSYTNILLRATKKHQCRKRTSKSPSTYFCKLNCMRNGWRSQNCTCFAVDTAEGADLSTACTPQEFYDCYTGIGDSEEEAVHDALLTQCGRKCSDYCDIDRYQFTHSFIPFNQNITNDKGSEMLRDTEVILDMFFSTMQETKAVQNPAVTVDALAGNIGGLLGLWGNNQNDTKVLQLGGSIIAAAHVFFFWITICLHNRKQRREKEERAAEMKENRY